MRTWGLLPVTRAVLTIAMVFITTNTRCGGAIRVLPAKVFHVQLVNEMSGREPVRFDCSSATKYLGPVTIAFNQTFDYRIRVDLFLQAQIECSAWHAGGGDREFDTNLFDAFKADEKFVKRNCEGDHCFWKAREDGIICSLGTATVPWKEIKLH